MLALPEHSTSSLDVVYYADCFQLMDWLYRAGIQVDLIATDMPYGTTACAWDKRVDLDQWWASVKRVLKPRGVCLTTASEPFASLLRVSNLDWYKYDWVWEKPNGTNFLNAPYQPLKTHELILIFSDSSSSFSDGLQSNYNPQMMEGKPYRWESQKSGGYQFHSNPDYKSIDNIGTRYPRSIIKMAQERGLHDTQKPTALYEYLIRTYTQPGDVVLDPFCGSGTTGLAALKTGRRYILGDSDLGYVEAARKRIKNADPMQPSQIAKGVTQLSLFAEVG